MTFNQLFKKRLSIYNKSLLKYSKYIFNDSFLLAFLLIIGAAGFVYSGYVQTLNTETFTPGVIMVLVMTIVIHIGRIALLLEPADIVFILPKENSYVEVLKKLTLRSFLIHLIPILIVTIIGMPLFVQTNLLDFSDTLLIFLIMSGWKWSFLVLCLYYLQKDPLIKSVYSFTIFFVASFLGLLLSVLISPVLGLGISILVAGFSLVFLLIKNENSVLLDWEWMIELEQNRKQVIYRFFNMFTDVPFVSTKTRRLAFLDPLIHWTSTGKVSSQEYYLKRVFLRNTTYSGLVIRLILIGGIILAFTNNLILSYIVSLLFNYLITFQLLPLSNHLERTIQFKFQPIQQSDNISAVKNIVFHISILVSLIFTIIVIPDGIEAVIGVIGLNIIFSFVFSYFYIPKRLIKK